MNLVTMTAADDDSSTPATQPDITVEGTFTWSGGGTIFGANPATATVVTSGGGHAAIIGDVDVSAAVPLLVNNSGLPYMSWTRGNPVVGAQAMQLINPTPTANHWLDLENTLSGTLDDVFIQQDGSNSDKFSVCLQSASVFDCPIQADRTGHFLGLGDGAPDPSYSTHLYNTTRIDSLSVNGGAPIATANAIPTVGTPTVGQAACIKAAGPPVVLGYCSTVVSSSGACTCN
jgi:hypothetical protein